MGRANRLGRAALVTAALSMAATGAIATPAWPATPPAVTSFTIPGALYGVAATSAGNAWAVGFSGVSGTDAKTLILHWNGTRWSQVTSPEPVYGALRAVSAVSAGDVWAVGFTSTAAGTYPKTLVMHWNGRAWSRQASAPAVAGWVDAVAARGNSVWAVGTTANAPSLFLHETGNRWYVVPSEAPASSAFFGVVVTGDNTAWAVGDDYPANATGGLVMRWDGTLWQTVSSPLQGANNTLSALAVGPAGAMWAVGFDDNQKFTAATTASMLWNGKTWRKVPIQLPPSSGLYGVTSVPGGTAWAVGSDRVPSNCACAGDAVILRWTGHAWTQAGNPDEKSSNLYAVAATSPGNAWAVGFAGSLSKPQTLILHWNGTTWS